MIFNFIKRLFISKPKSDIAIPEYKIEYDSYTNLWIARFTDKEGLPIGVVGFGPTKKSAIDDLFYQNIDLIK